MNETTFHTKITNFMEANGFETNEMGTYSEFYLEAPFRLTLVIEFRFEDGDDEIEVFINEVDGDHYSTLEWESFATLEEAQDYIKSYFSIA